MTESEALRLILKRRCAGVNCWECAYLASLCDDVEITQIVATLKLRPFTFKEEVFRGECVIVGRPADRSGQIVYPTLAGPPKPMPVDVEEIGLL